MNNEYVIINKTAIQKRIAELEKTNQIQRVDELENVLSQSTPLIPELEKTFEAARERIKHPDWDYIYEESEDYISNLKLDI